jgi:glutamyl-tRNA synthetase
MTVKSRFAPSPTGLLHVGNARTALITWLYAKAAGGRFVLRLDDTDRERSTEEFAQAIRDDLAWLGLDWDEEQRQSERLDRYDEVIGNLKKTGHLYACYETPDELERKRKLQLAQRKPPVYDRAALDLTADQIAAYEAEGRQPHWRFKLDRDEVRWHDIVRGQVVIDMASVSDPVVIRSDGSPLYHLCSVVDDADMQITHVVRGEDHVTNTAEHIQMFKAIGTEPPAFAHLALLTGAGGEGLSKRLGSLSLRNLRKEGIEAMAVVSLLARLGSADPVEPRADMADVLAGFEIGRFARNPAKFDPEELKRLNSKILHELPFAVVSERLSDLGLADAGEAFWQAVQGNLDVLADAADWWRIVHDPIEPVVEDADFCALAAEMLPDGDLNSDTWSEWTGALKAETGRKGKVLFHPLRLALTGRERGPEMKNLLPLIGSARAKARLRGENV